MLQRFMDFILEPFLRGSGWLHFISMALVLLSIFVLSVISYYITKFAISLISARLLKADRSGFLRILSKNKTLNLLAHISSGLILWSSSKFITEHDNVYVNGEAIILAKLALLYMMITCLFIGSRTVWSLNSYYEKKFDFAKQYPIYSYLKVIILFIWVIGIGLIISFFLNTSPLALLTGVGAVSALFLLVFKDTLLGIISSIQATALNIVRIGDRISINKFDLDGRVLDISINSVKVKNSNNTVVNIPTYMLTSEVVQNWRGVDESGVRQIKRPIYLDAGSIQYCDDDFLNELKKFPVVKEYLANTSDTYITNLTLLRHYFYDYLLNNKNISNENLVMVRHLAPTTYGLPLEVYAFTTTAVLEEYEEIQADIFEHLFAMLGEFRLSVFKSS